MKNSFRLALVAAVLGATTLFSAAEVVEEETWYNASGEVVKKVKRTYSGADADRTPDWEPAWVARERRASSRVVRYSSGRSYWGGSRYYAPNYFYPSSWCGSSYYRPSYGRSGLSGYYRSGGSGSKWGVSYRSRGLSIDYRD